MQTAFSYLFFNKVVPIEIQRNFPFYFGDGKSNFRHSGFMYDYGFDLVQSESFINIDFGLKRQIKFFLPFFYCFYPFYFKSSSLLFWKEFKFLLFKSLPVVNLEHGLDDFFFRGTFPLGFYSFSLDFNLDFDFTISDFSRDMWLSKNLINKLWYDTSLDVDSHVSLALIAGGVPSLKFGYLTTHFLDLTALTLVSDFKTGISFFLKSFDNRIMSIFRKFIYKKMILRKKNNSFLLNDKKIIKFKQDLVLEWFFSRRLFFKIFFNFDFYCYFVNSIIKNVSKSILYRLNWYIFDNALSFYLRLNVFLKKLKKTFKGNVYIGKLIVNCFWDGFKFIPIILKKKKKLCFGVWRSGFFHLLTVRSGFWDKHESFITTTDYNNLKYSNIKILEIRKHNVVLDNGMLKCLFDLSGFWYKNKFIWLFDVHESVFSHLKVKRLECFFKSNKVIPIQSLYGFWKGSLFVPLNCINKYLDFIFSGINAYLCDSPGHWLPNKFRIISKTLKGNWFFHIRKNKWSIKK